jgi:hypothetical protein
MRKWAIAYLCIMACRNRSAAVLELTPPSCPVIIEVRGLLGVTVPDTMAVVDSVGTIGEDVDRKMDDGGRHLGWSCWEGATGANGGDVGGAQSWFRCRWGSRGRLGGRGGAAAGCCEGDDDKCGSVVGAVVMLEDECGRATRQSLIVAEGEAR